MKFFASRLVSGIIVSGLCVAPLLAAAPQSETATEEKDMSAWKWANFAVLAAVLAYYGVKFGKPYFAGQIQSIQHGLEEAKTARIAAEARSAEVQKKLDNLDVMIEELRKSALDEQAALAGALRERSEHDLQRVWANAHQQIEKVGEQARWELQRFASGLAVALAEERLRGRMDARTQHELTGQFVRNLKG